MHVLCAILIGILYGDCGSNASKSIGNVGFLLIGVVYLWYTTVMPGVLKCKKVLLFFRGFATFCQQMLQFMVYNYSSHWIGNCAERNIQQLVQSSNIFPSKHGYDHTNSRKWLIFVQWFSINMSHLTEQYFEKLTSTFGLLNRFCSPPSIQQSYSIWLISRGS